MHQARDFARQLLESVAYMQRLELVHTDLKPENILLLDAESAREAPAPGGSKCARVVLGGVWGGGGQGGACR